MIRIKSSSMLPQDVKITTDAGETVEGVTKVTIAMNPGKVNKAEVDILVSEVDVMAHPLLSLETIKRAAAEYGYKLEEDK